MKTDRELLELAAKTAGIEGGWGERVMIGDDEVDLTDIWFLDNPETCAIWDPLTDDGDALRLAVKLGLYIDNEQERCGSVAVSWGCDDGGEHIGSVTEPAPECGDDAAATRRAIVRAAAAIGEAMQ